jgi:hypothetical protein
MQAEAPKNIPQGLKPPLLSAICGTTEVVPFQKMGHTRVFSATCKAVPMEMASIGWASAPEGRFIKEKTVP